MIRKDALREIVTDRLTGVYVQDKLSEVHGNMVDYWIGRAYAMIAVESYMANRSTVDQMTKTYDSVAVAQDSTTNIYYSDLPADILSLPGGCGIRKIATVTGEGVDFVPETNDNIDIMSGLEVDDLSGVISYTIKNDRVEYRNMDSDITLLRMDVVQTFEAYDDSEKIYIPMGMDERLLEIVVNFAIGKPPQDTLNDNNANTNKMVSNG